MTPVSSQRRDGRFSVCARHGAQRRVWRCQPIAKAIREVTWRCKSSGGLDDGNPKPNGNGGAAMCRRKEAAGITPARGARTADEAQRWWARGHNDSKPNVIRTSAAYMWRVDGVTVTRLTLGDLPACSELAALQGVDDARAGVSRGHSSGRTPVKGQTRRAIRSIPFDARQRRSYAG